MADEPIKTNPHRSGSKRSRAAEVHNMSEKVIFFVNEYFGML